MLIIRIKVVVDFTPLLPMFKICHWGQYQNHCRRGVLDTTLCDKVCDRLEHRHLFLVKKIYSGIISIWVYFFTRNKCLWTWGRSMFFSGYLSFLHQWYWPSMVYIYYILLKVALNTMHNPTIFSSHFHSGRNSGFFVYWSRDLT
jgi:hypothetical protein